MLRYFGLLLLPAALLLVPGESEAQFPRMYPPRAEADFDPLPGNYVNSSNGRACSVAARGRGYSLTNENGQRAFFSWAGPGRLQMMHGSWDPSVTVRPGRDAYGRTVLRFDSPSSPSGYWVSAY